MMCKCEDSNGNKCGNKLSKEEYDRDGMCEECAGHVWEEMISEEEYHWVHHKKEV